MPRFQIIFAAQFVSRNQCKKAMCMTPMYFRKCVLSSVFFITLSNTHSRTIATLCYKTTNIKMSLVIIIMQLEYFYVKIRIERCQGFKIMYCMALQLNRRQSGQSSHSLKWQPQTRKVCARRSAFSNRTLRASRSAVLLSTM